jgi:hypothetical protein
MDGRRLPALGDHEVDGLGACELDVRAGRVEVGVVGHDRAGPAEGGEQDLLGGPPLVRGDDVREREELLHGLQEDEPGRRARVALVAPLDRRPLVARHRPGAGVREEVDEDVVRVEVEQVEPRLADPLPPLLLGEEAERLHRVDPERLDDRVEPVRHGGPMLAEPAVRVRGRTLVEGHLT